MTASRLTRIALVAEELSDRPDEGALRVLERLAHFLAARTAFLALHARGSAPPSVPARRLRFSRIGVSAPLRSALRDFGPQLVLYAPSASLTANALWRARCLRATAGRPVVCIGLQRREHGALARLALAHLEPDALVVTADSVAEPFRRRGWSVVVARLGVDLGRFHPLGAEQRTRLREELGWSDGRRVLLHVGHLRRRRGLQVLEALARDRASRVVMVASTSQSGEEELAAPLAAAGIELHHEYVGDIERYYQAADAYIFGVREQASAIDFPLSVLEALACGTPVLATAYGALPEHFDGTGGLRFLGDAEDPQAALAALLQREADPRTLCAGFGWDAVFEELMQRLEEVLR